MSGGTTCVLLTTALVIISSVGSYVSAVNQWSQAVLARAEEPCPQYVAYVAGQHSADWTDASPAQRPDLPAAPAIPVCDSDWDERATIRSAPALSLFGAVPDWNLPE